MSPPSTPPRWASTLVGWTLPPRERRSALADLDELYARRVRATGGSRALAWYLSQCASFPVMRARSRVVDGVAATMQRTGDTMYRSSATGLARDIRYAVRALGRSPGFALTVFGTLGVGLAGAITVFALVYGILLTPLPYHEAERLVAIFTTDLGETDRSPTAPANVVDWRRDTRTLEHLTAAHPWSATLATDEPRKLVGLRATWSLFDLLRAEPFLGRTWHAQDSAKADVGVIVLGYALWQREFGGDSTIVGRTIRLDGVPYLVMGVMPVDFGFPPFWASDAEFWVPLDFGAEPSRRAQFVRVFGRMLPGAELEQVQSEFSLMTQLLADQYPEDLGGLGVRVERLHEPVVSEARPVLLGLFGATILLLLVGVANVANLMLARALAQQRDRAVRHALGASRRRLIAHELMQSLLLGGLAGAGGLVLAWLALRAISAMAWLGIPRVGELDIDGVVVIMALGTSLAIGLLFGLITALRDASGVTLLRAGVGQTFRRTTRIRDALVVTEVAMAVVLLVGAGLTVRSLAHQKDIDPGIRPEGVLTLTVDMGGTSIFPPEGAVPFSGDTLTGVERQMVFFRELVGQTETLPGVVSVGLMSHLPLVGDVWSTAVSRADRPPPVAAERLRAAARVISPGYLRTAGVAVLAGRPFEGWGENEGDEVIINHTLASTLWPDRQAIGERLRLGSDWDDPTPIVVGVVADVRQAALVDEVSPEFYRPYGQNPFPWNRETSLVVRTSVPPSTVAGPVRGVIRALAPAAPIGEVRTMADIVEEELLAARAVTLLVSVFAAFAVLVSGIGLFGVVNYLVGQRRREFGIRMALGSSPGAVAWSVLGQGLGLILFGVAIGSAITLAVSRLISSMLYQVPEYDPVAFGGAIIVLLVVGVVAVWWPAQKAAAADPVECLRAE